MAATTEHCVYTLAVVAFLVICVLYLARRSSRGSRAAPGESETRQDVSAWLPKDEVGSGRVHVSEMLEDFWRRAENWAFNRSSERLRAERPPVEVLAAIARQIKDITVGTFIGETAIVHAATLCAQAEQEPQTFLVYGAEHDAGQLAYMLGTWMPGASVLALHTTMADCATHAKFLAQMRLPGRLNVHEVVAAGTWDKGLDFKRLAETPTVMDVQIAIGTQIGQKILQPDVLRTVISLARWTLLSLPLEALDNVKGDDPIQRALASQPPNDGLDLDADVSVLGLVRVPATQEMQALFLIWAWHVKRDVSPRWHRKQESHVATIEFGVDRNATMTQAGVVDEVAGLTLETLLATGLPLGERVSLMAAALSDVRAGPAGWIVCCGGIWQWDGSSGNELLPLGATGIVSYLACTFLFAPKATEFMQLICGMCQACENEPLQEEFTSDNCIHCAGCLAHLVAPRLGSSVIGKRSTISSTTAPPVEVQGFAGPITDDIPGTGDLGNIQVLNVHECAHLCRENPRCYAFEYSATVDSIKAPVRNCQLDSSRTRAGIPFRDFVLYLKRGIPGSVDEQLVVNFDWAASGGTDDVEAIQDRGLRFGPQVGGPGQFGWICDDGPAAAKEEEPQSYSGKGLSTQPPISRCKNGDALSWQIAVPEGIYDVKVYVSGKAVLGCRASDVLLDVVDNQTAQDGSKKKSSSPVPEASFVQTAAYSTTAPGTSGTGLDQISSPQVSMLHSSEVSADHGVLRLSGCHTSSMQLVRVEVRRNWRHCPVPLADGALTVTEAAEGSA